MQTNELLLESGITKDDPDYWKHFNLCHASLSPLGIRNGLDPRIKKVMTEKGLGNMTENGRKHLIASFASILDRLQEVELNAN